MRWKSADKLATYVETYCLQHYEQVCASVFGMANDTDAADPDKAVMCGPRLSESTNPSSSRYGFFTAVTVLKAMARFNGMANQDESLQPAGQREIIEIATDVIERVFQTKRIHATIVVQHTLEKVPGFSTELNTAKEMPQQRLETHLKTMGKTYAHLFLLYCAAIKTADFLFDAWLQKPKRPPHPDPAALAAFTHLIATAPAEQGGGDDAGNVPGAIVVHDIPQHSGVATGSLLQSGRVADIPPQSAIAPNALLPTEQNHQVGLQSVFQAAARLR